MKQTMMEDLAIKAINEEARTVRFVATAFKVDRQGDIIHITPNKGGQGLILIRGDKTPLLYGHVYGEFPVGRAMNWDLTARKAEFDAQFFASDVGGDRAETAYQIAKTGILGVSVGVLPKIYGRRDPQEGEVGNIYGMEFFESELLEMSLTPVPANPAAIPTKDMEDLVRRMIHDEIEAMRATMQDSDEEKIAAAIRSLMQAPHPPAFTKTIRENLQEIIGTLENIDYSLWVQMPEEK